MPPPAELRNRPQDGISWIQEVTAVELGFLSLYLIVWGYVGIYRRKEYVGGATGGPRGWRARPGGVGAPSYLVASWKLLLRRVQVSWILFIQKSRSRRFHSVWTSFDIPFLLNTKIGKKREFALGLGLID